jgi:dTDP-4-dehydrorhamnose reductase
MTGKPPLTQHQEVRQDSTVDCRWLTPVYGQPNGSRRVLILGGRGYLGQQFLSLYPNALAPPLDISDVSAVGRALTEVDPEIVINCAGKCGSPNVDWCEDHRLETTRSNVLGAMVLLQACCERGIYLVHLSSGCIYDGDNGNRGFSEECPPNFVGNFYSRSKAWIDQIARHFPVLTLRLRMPFDGSTCGRNLLMKLRKYSRVLVEPNSLTYLPDFLDASRTLIDSRATGVFNVVNRGAISPYEVMEMYRDLIDSRHTFEPLSKTQLGEVARASRSNCILSTAKIEALGIVLRPVRAAVERALRDLAVAFRPPHATAPQAILVAPMA